MPEVDLPIVEKTAQLLNRSVEKSLFLGRKSRLRGRQQLCPIGATGEQLGIPPGCARFDRFPLGIGDGRKYALEPMKERTTDRRPSGRTEKRHRVPCCCKQL
jgi:hypothetical protein